MLRSGVVASTGLVVLLALIAGGCRSSVPLIRSSDQPRDMAALFEGFTYGGSVPRVEPIPTLNLNDLASEHAFLLTWSDQVEQMDRILVKRLLAMGFTSITSHGRATLLSLTMVPVSTRFGQAEETAPFASHTSQKRCQPRRCLALDGPIGNRPPTS
jgi:hypothetical protein